MPQVVDQLSEVVKFFVTLPVVAEQVTEVPTIILEDTIPQRAPLRAPVLAEQLVEVPTNRVYALAVVAVRILGWEAAAALSRSLTVPLPARGGDGERGGLHGLRPDPPEGDTARPGRDTNTGRRDDG